MSYQISLFPKIYPVILADKIKDNSKIIEKFEALINKGLI
jgi:hypothetical protein